jgi:hypothetical protein
MFYQKEISMSFVDAYVERPIHKNRFFKQFNILIDRSEIEKERLGYIAYNLYKALGIVLLRKNN